jgi:eukaryotic-like serine/threonine-protein kinase
MIGTSIAHYTVIEELGRGGMGVVWKARDHHLDRFVAIKVLSSEVVEFENVPRLVHEAKAASALNHPNIVHIYDVGDSNGLPYIAMEYVPGKTLAERINRRGLRLSEALKYGAQIADAMATAHHAGILHRDLKPGNIIIGDTGNAKILDFGLAKVVGSGTNSYASTQTFIPEVSRRFAGTVPYLSPEQAEGLPLNLQSDIFSFGIILYEMISGINPFLRASQLATIAAILNEEPKPLHELVPSVPAEVERLITRCLRKSPEQRLRSMADLAIALKELQRESDSGQLYVTGSHAASNQRRRFMVGTAIGLASLTLISIGLWKTRRDRAPAPSYELTPITTYPGTEMQPSLSPDGAQVAFSWNGAARDKFHIFLKALGPGPPLQLTHAAADDTAPAWSPDGGSIAFLRTQGNGRFDVFVIPALGGSERKLTEISIPEIVWMPGPYLSWTPDSRSLVLPDRPTPDKPTAIFLFPIQTGEKRQLTFPSAGILGDSCPALSPDGRALAFCRCSHLGAWITDVYLVELSAQLQPTAEPRQVVPGHSLRVNGLTWNRIGTELVFGASRQDFGDQGLWRVPITSTVAAPASELKLGIASWPTAARLSPRLAFGRSMGGGLNILRLQIHSDNKNREVPRPLIDSTREDFAPGYSPDGHRIAFESDRSGNLEIWTCNDEGQDCLQVTTIGSAFTGLPSWSPDGKQIAFYSRKNDKSHIFVIGADGTGLRQLTFGDSNELMPRWSRDGAWIYYSSNATEPVQVWKVPSQGGAPVQVTRNGGFASLESLDGKWLYYTKNQAADTSLWKRPLAGGEELQVLPSVQLHNFDVVNDGLYFLADTTTLKFLDAAGASTTVAHLPPGYVGLSVSPDRRWIVFTAGKPEVSELIMVENFQ